MSVGPQTRVGRLKIRVDRVIYTTITLMAVLIVYDGWEQLRLGGVVAVMLGPILAIFLSHVFGAALGTRVALGRPLTRGERRAVSSKSADSCWSRSHRWPSWWCWPSPVSRTCGSSR